MNRKTYEVRITGDAPGESTLYFTAPTLAAAEAIAGAQSGRGVPAFVRVVEAAEVPAYTHAGHKTATNYQHTGRNWGHTAPVAGKIHALNADGYRAYASLCGERVGDDAGQEAGQYQEADRNVFPAGERRVTCKRCLAKLRGGGVAAKD